MMTTLDEQIAAIRRSFQSAGSTFASAGVAIQKWADAMHAEAMWRQLEQRMRSWSPEERDEYQRLVRRLHDHQPDLSLTDCMLAVSAAMEACR